ncbi:substrate-binding domain-containing protein [Paenarthrobacter sp. AT5]|uniref:LacI family DNA-binding transcriptional regulator n=1 Tax=Paenarthrobacter TaxID=1742992 RepID=UPI001F61140E|nr:MULTISPECIES: substrate-binding domain-containing protein [Paenarthrobacter]WOC61416.1 substrate-binding domain-containing protein [Paenarthrobacter sp. AT5]
MLSDITNPVFFDLVRGAERTTAELGQTLVVAETLSSSEIEQTTVERLLPTVDGVILASSRLDENLVRRFSEVKNVVLVNRRVDDVPSVVPQLLPGIRDAVDHLAELGHKHIVYLSGPSALWMSRRRFKLLAAECDRAGLSVVSTSSAEPTMEGGRSAVAEVMASGASAVVAYNDLMAIGLLLACAEQNRAVPGDISIIGFDDIFGSRFTSPPLTTIRTPLSLVGAEAVRQLAEPKGSLTQETDDALATEFVRRRSTGPRALS